MKKEMFNASGAKDPTAFEAIENADAEMEIMERPVVYICSPLRGNTEKNKSNARRYSRFAALNGAVPFTPHLLYTQFLDDDIGVERRTALGMNRRMMKRCDELWVFGRKISSGMAQEIAWAKGTGMRIRYFTEGCREVDS